MATLSEEQDQAQRILDEAIGKATRIGCGVGPDLVVDEWVAVVATTNLATGRGELRRMVSHDLRAHHRDGLLHHALHCDWDDEEG